MNCIECQESLVDHQEGLLDVTKRNEVDEHLAGCPGCRAEYAAVGQLQLELAARGKAAAGVSVVNRVMSQIRASQQPAPEEAERHALGRAGFWRWAMGFGAVAGAAILGTLLLTSPATKATAAEVMSRGVQAVRQLASVHLVCRVRTAPNDNFAQIDPKAAFVTVELWKEFGDPPKWRVEKPGRVAVVDGQSTLLYLKNANAALKVPRPSVAAFDTGWLHELADIEGTLASELRLKQVKMNITRETDASGAVKALVTVEAKSGLPEGDYLKNVFFNTADTRRLYRFDDRTGKLEALRVYLCQPSGDVPILEVERIDYNAPIEAEVFQLALPANVNWIDPGKPQANGSGYTAATPEAAARAFFEACGREDWAVAAKFWPLPLDDRFKQFLGGMEIVNLGQSFTSAAGPAKFVPYEIRMKNGAIRKHNLALKQHQGGSWFVDGGL